MRRGRIFFYLAFIIVFGVLAFYLIWQRFLQPGAVNTTGPQPTPVIATVNVIVVTQKVPRATALTADVLGMVPIQQDLFFEGMFTDISEVEGRMVKFDLDAGIPLTRGMLADSAEQLSGTGSTAALSIPRGMVAISVPISRLSSVSYAPQSGDHVNVIVTMMFVDLDTDFQAVLPNLNTGVLAPGSGEGTLTGGSGSTLGGAQESDKQEATRNTQALIQTTSVVAVSGSGGSQIGKAVTDTVLAQSFYHIPSESQRPRMVSQNLLQDAVVLRVGDFSYTDEGAQDGQAQPTPEAPVAEGQEAATPPPAPDVITLIVSPQDAITLNYLLYSGAELTLALRAAEDDSRVATESVTLQFLLEQYNITVPAKLPNGMEPATRTLEAPTLKNDAVPTPAQ